ncbi:MAG: arsenic resistance protein, partial [Pigmentiphaga sp.]
LERLLWPGLALLLYATFTQVPFDQLPAAFKDGAFISAALLGNFVVLPVLVLGVVALAPGDPAIRLGLLLVLLVPCTDWFITFAHQAGGDLRRAITITPVLLIAQMLLLPLYLWLFMGKAFMEVVSAGRMITVFMVVLVLPLILAWLTERWVKGDASRSVLTTKLGGLPIPLLALVLFLISASQVEAVRESLAAMGSVFLACLVFLVGATICGLIIGRVFRLPVPQARTLVFTLTTRNSFVVLPFALALPGTLGMASITIIFQSLIELFGMLVLLWLIPNKLLPSNRSVKEHRG